MQTFHKGGVQTTDITQGLPRVEELFEARSPKAEASISTVKGKVHIDRAEDDSATITIVGTREITKDVVISDAKSVLVTDGAKVKNGQVLYIDSEEMEKQSPYEGTVKIEGGVLTISGTIKAEESVSVLPKVQILVNDGDTIEAGTQLTEGSIDPKKLADTVSIQAAQKYVLDEVQRVFNEQAVPIGDIHVEVVIRQMARLGRVLDSGDSEYLVGSMVNRFVSDTKNNILLKDGKRKALVVPKLLGIKASALHTESFLSAMSFQEQVRVLTNSAILGKTDFLRGMKENVIIGRRIPSGESAAIKNLNDLEEIKF
jgi:DNA-directed RNA polymerase subunit beta'